MNNLSWYSYIRYIIVVLIVTCTSSVLSHAWWSFADLATYHEYVSRRNRIAQQDISPQQLRDMENQTWNQSCRFERLDNMYYALSPYCFLSFSIPTISISEAVDSARWLVQSVTDSYDLEANHFTYQWGRLIVDGRLTQSFQYYNYTDSNKYLLLSRATENKRIKVHKGQLAVETLKQLWVSATHRVVTDKTSCTMHNYLTALRSLDGVWLQPWQDFVLNDHIANLDGYCKGRSKRSYLFYGGVCGASGQLFRTSLIHPHIKIVERAPHSYRRAAYYGDTVIGDDAAVYENSKRLVVHNTGVEPILLKVIENEEDVFLVALTSQRFDQSVTVTKNEIGINRGKVTKQVRNKDGTLVSYDERESWYTDITHARVN